MSEELDTCPFCGGKAIIKSTHACCIWCACSKCNARTEGYCPNLSDENAVLDNIEKSKNMAISAWNTRKAAE